MTGTILTGLAGCFHAGGLDAVDFIAPAQAATPAAINNLKKNWHPLRREKLKSPYQALMQNNLDLLEAPDVNDGKLSAGAAVLAQTLGVSTKLSQLMALPTGTEREKFSAMILKQEITEAVLCQSLEVRSCLGRLDVEIAEADDLQAFLQEKRDKAIRLNTIANFISGGITGIIGGSMDIGGVDERGPGSIDIGEGITQTSLALLALKQQSGEKHLMEGLPSMLARLFDQDGQQPYAPSRDYPKSVWDFINEVPPGQMESRKAILIRHWKELKIVGRHKVAKAVQGPQLPHVTATHPNTTVTIDLLDARAAMLHDVRAVISQMDHYLLEIMQEVRSKKL